MRSPRKKWTPDLAEDRPIERAIDDRLDRVPFVENLARALIREEKDIRGRVVARRSTGVVVGLTGKWGSGKSSVLNLLSEHLKAKKHVVVATLNPWLFKGRDELLTAFFNELRDSMGRSLNERGRDIITALEKYQGSIGIGIKAAGHGADLLGAGGAGSAVATGAVAAQKKVKKPKDLSPQEERRSLEKKLTQANIAVVVLVDELDRVDDDDVRAVAQLVKAIGDIKGVSYLVAYDPERVADALGRGTGDERRRSGEAYLEKIIQHPIPLRPLFMQDVAAFLDALLQHHGLRLPIDLTDEEQEVVEHIRSTALTPRELKRLVGSYAVLDPMLRGEISPADLLGYCWILTKAPSLRDVIAAKPDVVVDDPSHNEIANRVTAQLDKKHPDLASVLGSTAGDHEKILKLLFPRFGRSRRTDSGNRLSRRRNLIRTLYLGDPPGIASRNAVESAWNETDEVKLVGILKNLKNSGNLRPLIDRLEDLLPKLPKSGAVRFWRSLASALIRNDDWYLAPEEDGAIAEDAAMHLMRLGLRDRKRVEEVKEIIDALAQANDLVILPDILRKHLFRWGLTTHSSSPRGGDAILDVKETEALLGKVVGHYRDALLNGTLLRRVPNCEALFVISNADKWDVGARDSLTKQLEVHEGRASFAALMVPPGHSIDRESLDRLVDADEVLRRMELAGEGATQTTWIDTCLRRLRYSLSGKSTISMDDDDEDYAVAKTDK